MSNEKMLRPRTFWDKLKTAWRVIIGKDVYAELERKEAELEASMEERNAALEERDAALSNREAKVQKAEQALEAKQRKLNERASQIADRENEQKFEKDYAQILAKARAGHYVKEKRISPKVPEIQVHATKCMSNRFVGLQGELLELEGKVDQLEGVEIGREEEERIILEFESLKGKLLGEMAIMMETMTPNEISKTAIGDKQLTVGVLAKALPEMLGILKSTEKSTINRCFVDYTWKGELYTPGYYFAKAREKAWIDGLFGSYAGAIDDLRGIGFFRGDNHDEPDYKSHLAGTEDGVAYILNRYFGVPETEFSERIRKGIENRKCYSPLRSYHKPTQMMEFNDLNISENPVIGEMMGQISDIAQKLGDEGER